MQSSVKKPANIAGQVNDGQALTGQRTVSGFSESPALKLRSYLSKEIDRQYKDELLDERWSARRTAAFVFVFCSLSWAGIILGLKALF